MVGAYFIGGPRCQERAQSVGAAPGDALVGRGTGEGCAAPGVELDDDRRFRRTVSLVSRIECLTTMFCSLKRMTNSFFWTSLLATRKPT